PVQCGRPDGHGPQVRPRHRRAPGTPGRGAHQDRRRGPAGARAVSERPTPAADGPEHPAIRPGDRSPDPPAAPAGHRSPSRPPARPADRPGDRPGDRSDDRVGDADALPRQWWTVAVAVLAQTLVLLDNTVLNIAMETLADPVRGLGADASDLAW